MQNGRTARLRQAISRGVSVPWSHVVANAGAVDDESHQWFVVAHDGYDRGARFTRGKLGAFGRAIATHCSRMRYRVLGLHTPRERLRSMLLAEAERSRVAASQTEIRAFADNMAAFLELIFTGAIAVTSISFEAAPDHARQETPEPEPREAELTERAAE